MHAGDMIWESRMGGFQQGQGGLAIVDYLRLLCEESVIARAFLLEADTSLAIATSGLRTNLLLQELLSENSICKSQRTARK